MVKWFPFWPTGAKKPEPVETPPVVESPSEPQSTALVTTQQDFEPPQLGDRVYDPITKFEGIVIVMATFLNGCVRLGVQGETLKDGKIPVEEHFDQGRLRVKERAVHRPLVTNVVEAPPPEPRRAPGGPPRSTPSATDVSDVTSNRITIR